ncbi:MAG: hypothetical protein P9M07_04150 [Candidatus Aceula meridiana]|nr:hypothetical protein [Candidatus Aceula meridiana]
MKIRTYFLFLVFFLMLQSSLFSEEVFHSSYSGYDLKGNKRWQASFAIEANPEDRKDVYVLTEKGSGKNSGFFGEISWEERLTVENGVKSMRPIRGEKRIFDKDGNLIVEIFQTFDFEKHKTIFRRQDFQKGTKEENIYNFKFKGDIVSRLLLGLYVRRFLQEGKRKKTFFLLTGEPHLYKFTARLVQEEDVLIEGKTRRAYKILLDPHIGIFSFLKIVFPKVYIWHLAEPDYRWLKYRGIEESLTSPKVEIVADGVGL